MVLRHSSTALVLCAALPLLFWGAAARAGSPALAEAKAHLEALDWDKALETGQALLRRGGNEPDELRELYALTGHALASLGRESEAREAFRNLLALQPDYRLPESTSPKIRAPLAQALSDWAGRPGLTTTHASPGQAPVDRPLRLVVQVSEDPMKAISRARLRYRLPGSSAESSLQASPAANGELAFSLPLPTLGIRPGPLRYNLELLDASGNILRRHGSRSAPLVVSLAGEERAAPASAPRWYSRWWIWTVAGAVLAGTATALILTTTSRHENSFNVSWTVKSPADR